MSDVVTESGGVSASAFLSPLALWPATFIVSAMIDTVKLDFVPVRAPSAKAFQQLTHDRRDFTKNVAQVLVPLVLVISERICVPIPWCQVYVDYDLFHVEIFEFRVVCRISSR
jgi:hypothetical protein